MIRKAVRGSCARVSFRPQSGESYARKFTELNFSNCKQRLVSSKSSNWARRSWTLFYHCRGSFPFRLAESIRHQRYRRQISDFRSEWSWKEYFWRRRLKGTSFKLWQNVKNDILKIFFHFLFSFPRFLNTHLKTSTIIFNSGPKCSKIPKNALFTWNLTLRRVSILTTRLISTEEMTC